MNGLRLVGGDTMNYWISDYREDLLKTMEWDFLLINDSEARMLSGENNLRRAAEKIIGMGPHTLVIKRGSLASFYFERMGISWSRGICCRSPDPTGASCLRGGSSISCRPRRQSAGREDFSYGSERAVSMAR